MNCEKENFNEISEEYLQQNDWWWRRFILGEFQSNLSLPKPFQIIKSREFVFVGQSSEWSYWKKKVEFPSYRYELARRCLGRESYLPWPQLSLLQQSFLLGGLALDEKSVRVIAEPLKDSSNWSAPMLPWQWRLDVSDNSLIESFMVMINEERRRNKIPEDLIKKKSKSGKSTSSNEGNFNRGVSWRGIELLDIQFHKIKKFENNSETSSVSKMKKESRKWAKEVKQLLKAHDSFGCPSTESDSFNFVFKFLSENYTFTA